MTRTPTTSCTSNTLPSSSRFFFFRLRKPRSPTPQFSLKKKRSPVSEKETTRFSPCSIGNICTAIGSSLNTTCIVDQSASNNPRVISYVPDQCPARMTSGVGDSSSLFLFSWHSEQSCGNGIVEDGEECDPGSVDSACCDPSTCRFRSGAVCDPVNSLCCTSMCQIAQGGTVCRSSIDSQCDKQEVCDGTNAACPKDEFESNGPSQLSLSFSLKKKRSSC